MRGGVPPKQPQGGADPWAAFGYLVSGVAVYGLLGWGLSVWLDASWPIPVGILVGAGLGILLVFYQLTRSTGASERKNKSNSTESEPDDPPADSGDGPTDRGETE